MDSLNLGDRWGYEFVLYYEDSFLIYKKDGKTFFFDEDGEDVEVIEIANFDLTDESFDGLPDEVFLLDMVDDYDYCGEDFLDPVYRYFKKKVAAQ